LLEVTNLRVCYGKINALKCVSLRVEEKHIFTLIGANGAGKTTIVRTIMGLTTPNEGMIRFLGEDISSMKPCKRATMGIAIVPEGRQLFYDFTVKENLLAGAFCRTDRSQINRSLDEIFEIFPVLKQRQNQISRTLSGGEGQMLALGRALMANPKLILMDEPSMGLMPVVVTLMFEVIEKLRERGKTIFLVEQNASMALDVSQMGALIELGEIVLYGDSKQITLNPKIKESYLGG